MTSKMFLMIIINRTVIIFQVAWSLPVGEIVAIRNFYENFITFVHDKRFKQAMESNFKTFN